MLISENKLNNLKNNVGKISINQMLNILVFHGVNIQDIKFIPALIPSSSGSTILDVYVENNIFYIKINIFKVKAFSNIESKFEKNIHCDNTNYLNTMIKGIEILLPIQAFGSKKIEAFTQEKIEVVEHQTIDNLIAIIYQELREKYCLCINYHKSFAKIILKSDIIGKNNINSIFLNGFTTVEHYIITITITTTTKTNFNKINQILKKKVYFLLKNKINIPIPCKLKVSISSTELSDKRRFDYISHYII